MLYAFEFVAGIVAIVLVAVSVIQTRWATAFWALALTWAMCSARSRLDELALAALVCGLTAYEIREGFKTAQAQSEPEEAETPPSSRPTDKNS